MTEAMTPSPKVASLQELQMRREQVEKELELLSQSYARLKEAQDCFVQNISTLTGLKGAAAGQEVLVPLTSSVYVVSQLAEIDRVMIDIGTGYYVEKVHHLIQQYHGLS